MANKIKPMATKIRMDLQLYPHSQDPKMKHDDRYDSSKYISVQTRVNHDSEFEKKYISKIVSEGWVALKKVEDIFIFPKGKAFKYRLNGDSMSGAREGTFRSGGWLIGKNLDDPENNDKYILYKGYNGAVFSLQIKDILEIYIKSPKREISIFKKPGKETKYPVFLPDPVTGEDIVVYFAKDEFNRVRFTNSNKYQKALATGRWDWSVVFNDDL